MLYYDGGRIILTLFIPEYSLGNKMLLVAKNNDVLNEMRCRSADVMFISDDIVAFYPEEHVIDKKLIISDRLDKLCDYDIVEISSTGILYRAFANNEADTTLFLGSSCNSNCIMCPATDMERKNGFSYSRELLMKYIDYLPSNLEHLVITGGEPTMQVDLFLDSLQKVKEKFKFTQVLLLTNGRSLSDHWFYSQLCMHKPANFRIAIPIHGDSPLLHDKITRVPGSFEQTILGLYRLMDSDITVEIRIVVTKFNCDNLTNIAKLIIKHFPKVSIVNFIGLEPRGNCALNFRSVYIDHKTAFLKSQKAIDSLINHGYDVGLYNFPLCSINKDYWPIAAKSISQYKNTFPVDCNQCSVKRICAGFFSSAISITHPIVTPYMTKEFAE